MMNYFSTSLSPAIIFAVCILTLSYKFIIYPLLLSPLAKIPKPHFSCSISGAWIRRRRQSIFEANALFAAHEKYGAIVQVAPDEIRVNSLDGLRQIYGNFNREAAYLDFMNYGRPSLLTMINEKHHAMQRKMLIPVFSKSYVQNSMDLRVISTVLIQKHLLPLIHYKAVSGDPVDVLQLFYAVAEDFISAYHFGISNSTRFVQNPQECAHYLNLFRKRLYDGDKEAHGELEEHCLSLLRAAKSDQSDQTPHADGDRPYSRSIVYSRLSSAFDKLDSKSDQVETELDIAAELLDTMDAGREGNHLALLYAAHELSVHPDWQAKLRAEINGFSLNFAYDGSSSTSEGLEPLPEAKAINTLPILDAIVTETLRLRPPVPSPQPRVVPTAGATIEGHFVPGGTKIFSSARCLHTNPTVFSEPNAFLPERWLQREDDSLKEMRRWMWAFGSGGKMCIGNHWALQGLFYITLAAKKTRLTQDSD
jgi:cytochrome P450